MIAGAIEEKQASPKPKSDLASMKALLDMQQKNQNRHSRFIIIIFTHSSCMKEAISPERLQTNMPTHMIHLYI